MMIVMKHWKMMQEDLHFVGEDNSTNVKDVHLVDRLSSMSNDDDEISLTNFHPSQAIQTIVRQ